MQGMTHHAYTLLRVIHRDRRHHGMPLSIRRQYQTVVRRVHSYRARTMLVRNVAAVVLRVGRPPGTIGV